MEENCGITLEHLVNYAEGLLDPGERVRIEAHLGMGCAACAERLNWLGDAAAAIGERFELPSSRTVRRAQRIYRDRRPSPVAALMRLVFDSRAQTPLTALARGGDAFSFRLLYHAEGCDLDVYGEETAPGRYHVIGQARSPEEGSALVPQAAALLKRAAEGEENVGEQEQVSAATMEGSEFHFAEVPAGRYTLALALTTGPVTVPDLQVWG